MYEWSSDQLRVMLSLYGCSSDTMRRWHCQPQPCLPCDGHGRASFAAEPIKNSACLDCHGDKTLTKTNAAGKEVSLFVDIAKLAASVHKTNTCVSCHADITSKHPDDNVPAQPPNCKQCHERQSESYGASVHGLALAKGQKDAATCSDCHDGHTILPPTSPLSPLYFSRLAETCGRATSRRPRTWRKAFMARRWLRATATRPPAPIAIPSIRSKPSSPGPRWRLMSKSAASATPPSG